jgi:hypothetical protein
LKETGNERPSLLQKRAKSNTRDVEADEVAVLGTMSVVNWVKDDTMILTDSALLFWQQAMLALHWELTRSLTPMRTKIG